MAFKINPQQLTLVLAGGWNKQIFTPQWLVKNLKVAEPIEILLPLNDPTLPPIYRFEAIHSTIVNNRLTFSFPEPKLEALKRARDLAVAILDYLPHTPATGVGWNWGYFADPPSANLGKVLEPSDVGMLSDFGLKIQASAVKRTFVGLPLAKPDGIELNFSIQLTKESKIHVDFNFHRVVASAEEASTYLKSQSIEELFSVSTQLLADVYNETTVEPIP